MVRLARRKAERRLAVFGCILLCFPVQRVPLQKGIVFLLLEPTRRARAFLISRCHVARGRRAGGFRFGAFKHDDFLRHLCYSFVSTAGSSSSPSRASSS